MGQVRPLWSLSKHFITTGVRATGQKSFSEEIFAFLGTGTIITYFRHLGTDARDRDKLKISVKIWSKFFSTVPEYPFWTPSRPTALRGFTLRNMDRTSLVHSVRNRFSSVAGIAAVDPVSLFSNRSKKLLRSLDIETSQWGRAGGLLCFLTALIPCQSFSFFSLNNNHQNILERVLNPPALPFKADHSLPELWCLMFVSYFLRAYTLYFVYQPSKFFRPLWVLKPHFTILSSSLTGWAILFDGNSNFKSFSPFTLDIPLQNFLDSQGLNLSVSPFQATH